MSRTQPTVYLVDGSAYIHRAFHAIAPLATKNGLPTNAVFGFINTLLRVIREQEAGYLAVAFDAPGPTFRHEIFADYKANRPSMPDELAQQMPYTRQIVEAYQMRVLEQEGVEADDLIASAAARLAAGGGCRVVVVSGDKDLLQLVDEQVVMWDPMTDRWYDADGVRQRYGVAPAQLLDYFALVGDPSDNVPGVAGVGPKTAAKLLGRFGTLEGIYADPAALGKGKMAAKIIAGREAAFLSRDLIRLRRDLPVPAELTAYRLRPPDQERLRAVLTELEFTRLLQEEAPAPAMSTDGFCLVTGEAELQELVEEWRAADWLVVDVETDSLDPLTANLVGVAVALPDGERAWYLPFGHEDEQGGRLAGQLDKDKALALLRPVLAGEQPAKVAHNLKFDYAVLLSHGIRLQGELYDTMIASYVLDPVRRSHKLDVLCVEELQVRPTAFAEVVDGDKRPDAFVRVLPAAACDYACEDAVATARLWRRFRPRLEERDQWRLFAEVEMPLVPILAEMERRGVLVSAEELDRLAADFARRLAEIEERIYRLAGERFNINSPRQLGAILFDKLGLPHRRKTKTGYSTDVKVLEKLARQHDLPAAVMEHRTLAKLQSTYVTRLRDLIHPRTGRVHTSFNQTVTATGRLSSSHPNLQNIPTRTEEGRRIRNAFTTPAGWRFVAADYSQIDLRVLAHYSGDEALIAAFHRGEDIHTRTAAQIFWVDPALVTGEMRRVAKTINFGIVYGMSAHGLAEQLDISRKEAAVFIERYFEHYSGVRRYMTEIVELAGRQGYVTTLLNRRRDLPEIHAPNPNRRRFAERTAINTPIQGTAADIIKLATIAADRAIRETGLAARLVLQIHDELVFETPEEEVERLTGLLPPVMEGVMRLAVPLKVHITTGHTLAEV